MYDENGVIDKGGSTRRGVHGVRGGGKFKILGLGPTNTYDFIKANVAILVVGPTGGGVAICIGRERVYQLDMLLAFPGQVLKY